MSEIETVENTSADLLAMADQLKELLDPNNLPDFFQNKTMSDACHIADILRNSQSLHLIFADISNDVLLPDTETLIRKNLSKEQQRFFRNDLLRYIAWIVQPDHSGFIPEADDTRRYTEYTPIFDHTVALYTVGRFMIKYACSAQAASLRFTDNFIESVRITAMSKARFHPSDIGGETSQHVVRFHNAVVDCFDAAVERELRGRKKKRRASSKRGKTHGRFQNNNG